MARAPLGPDIRWHAGAAELDLEARRLEGIGQKLGALDLLHAELAEEIERVADVGHLLGVAVDDLERKVLALIGGDAARDGQRERQNRNRAQATRSYRPHRDLLFVLMATCIDGDGDSGPQDGSAGHAPRPALIVDILELADQLRRGSIDGPDDLLRLLGAEQLDRQELL